MKKKIKAISVVLTIAYRSVKKVLVNKKFKEKDPANAALNIIIYQTRKYTKETKV